MAVTLNRTELGFLMLTSRGSLGGEPALRGGHPTSAAKNSLKAATGPPFLYNPLDLTSLIFLFGPLLGHLYKSSHRHR